MNVSNENPEPQLYVSLCSLITEPQNYKEKIYKQGSTDQLTKILGQAAHYQLLKTLDLDSKASRDYSDHTKQGLKNLFNELIGIGYYAYYADTVNVHHSTIKKYNNLSFKQLEIIWEQLELTEELDDIVPEYIFSSLKRFWLDISSNLYEREPITKLNSIHSSAFMGKGFWVIMMGYAICKSQETITP